MALIKAWVDNQTGLVFDQAYHRVNGLVLDYQARTAQFTVLIYLDAAARKAGKHPFVNRAIGVRNLTADEIGAVQSGQTTHAQLGVAGDADFDALFGISVLDAAGINPIAQAYKALQAHPLYASAVDG